MSIKVVVPISGGKDSQACLKLALTQYEPHEMLGLFCDTKFEHPLTYAHVDKIGEMYGVDIETINNGSVVELVRKYKRFPHPKSRFCTDRLKTTPTKWFFRELAQKLGHGFEVWYGMRWDESTQRNKRYRDVINTESYLPHELLKSYPQYLGKMGVRFRLPIVDWTTGDVLDFLGDEANPLYKRGAKRVGCCPCLASGDENKEGDFNLDDFGQSQREVVITLEKEIGKSVWTSKGGAARNATFEGCAICAI